MPETEAITSSVNKKEMAIAEDEEGVKTKQLWGFFDILSSEKSILLLISGFFSVSLRSGLHC